MIRGAALNWSLAYTEALEKQGFRTGASSPCTVWHPSGNIALANHLDDFVSEGVLSDLRWFEGKLKECSMSKTEVMGEANELAKEIRLLTRIRTWSKGDVLGTKPAPR